MTRLPPAFTLRPASADDLALAYTITCEAMQVYFERTWGAWDEAGQFQQHSDSYTPAGHRIVLVDGQPAGLLATELAPTHLQLVKLYLRRGQCGQGLGSALLRMVCAEAAALGRPVRLRVLRVNTGAQRLYLRHGFRVVDETPERLFLQRD